MTVQTLSLVNNENLAPPSISYLLTIGNDPKTIKGEKLGYKTGILYLSPANQSGIVNLCQRASAGCAIACLNTAGRGKMSGVQKARLNKTIWFVRFKPQFWSRLIKEIKALINRCKKLGFIPVIRLNGTSDNLWERMHIKGTEFDGLTIFEAFPDVQFYDYTKYTYSERENIPNNYHLTYSYSEDTTPEILHENLANGRNVAVVFNVCKFDNKGKHHIKCTCPLPSKWHGYNVISGDDSDIRFDDPQGVIIGLHAKGDARTATSGFAVNI